VANNAVIAVVAKSLLFMGFSSIYYKNCMGLQDIVNET